MKKLTIEEVKTFIKNTPLNYLAIQPSVSFPILQRIHRRLQNGCNFSPIKINEGIIVDGHHRYICTLILERKVEEVPGGENATKQVTYEWSKVLVDEADFDTEDERNDYEERYDRN